jgi:hypothetical protein
MAMMQGSWVDMEWSTRRGTSQQTRGWRRTRSCLPVTVPVFGRSGAASVKLRRRLLVALVLLHIRKKVKGMWLDKARRTGGIRGSRVTGNLGLMASQRSSPTRSPRAWTRRPGGSLAKLAEGMERMVRGLAADGSQMRQEFGCINAGGIQGRRGLLA